MANNISLSKNYTNLIDEVYKTASVTADLISDSNMMKAGGNGNEILYPQISVSGLGNYDRNSGYTNGSVDVVWKTATFNYDRGTKLSIDTMDDAETFQVAFHMAGATLQREKVAPEADAFTFATLAGTEGISVTTPETYASAEAFLEALMMAKSKMDEDEVPEEGRVLYATHALLNSIMALDTTKSKEVLTSFEVIRKVPQSRFYTTIELLDGKTSGEELGHYKKAVDGKDINFMIVHKGAVIKFDKHVVGDIIDPVGNPDADSYIVKYRKYGIVDVYKNKVAGIYLSHKA